MTDLAQALTKAVYDRLRAQIPPSTNVAQHPSANSAPPLVMISDLTLNDSGAKSTRLFRVDLTVIAWVRGQSRAPLNALHAQIAGALDDWRPANTAAVLFQPLRLQTQSAELQPEGDSYVGVSRFSTFVQPA